MPPYNHTQSTTLPRSLSISDIQDILKADDPDLIVDPPTEFHPFYSPCSLALDLSPTDTSSSSTSQYDDSISTTKLAYEDKSTSHRYSETPPSDYFLKYFYKPPIKQENDIGSLQIRVLGIPSEGAKSRVETQIRLCLQLITKEGIKTTDWSYIKIDKTMLARSRLRRNTHQKLMNDSIIAMVSDELKVLHLEAKVVCSNNTGHPIRMCAGCVRRERKRAERTKDGKSKKELSSQPEDIEAERDRILLFNCNSMVKFNAGDLILPTRITCYCRHHSEKEGFKICFVLKDDQGDVVATGMSPPIMITDDHKSSKQNNHNRKRVREEEKPDTPAPSRPGSVYNGEEDYPVESMTTTFDPVLLLSDESDKHKPVNQRKQTRRKKQTRQKHPKQPKKRDSKQEEPMILLPQSTEMVYDGVFYMNDVLPCLSDPIDFLSVDISPEESAEDAWPFNRRRKIDNDYYIPHDGLLPMLDEFMSVVPQLERLVPAQGPTYGGIEVTILGKGFYQGLTCLFGEHPATTAYWNSSTMVCILPPVAHTGPVVVSFKEHPVVLECHDVAIFTYYDASDQALLELALQVVGLKMTGKLHDAKDVAMRIVQGDQPNRQSTHNICQSNDSGHTLLHLAVILNYDELIKSLLAYPTPNEESDLVNMKDKNGMTALHFACLLGHVDLVKVLLKAGADPSLQSLQLKTPGALNDSTIISGLLSSYTNLRRKSLTRRPSVKSHMTHRFHSLTGKELPANVDANKAPSMESDGLGLVRQKLDRRLYLFWLPVLIVAIGLLCVQFIGRPSVIFESLLEKKIQDHSISLGA